MPANMTPERWQQVKSLFHRAREIAPDERPSFLDHACSSDHSLRREVESLLSSDDEARSNFLALEPPHVTLVEGTKLGDYEVQKLIGFGGMGEVYCARDSRLRRDVAIKVLPSFLSSDKERLRRFEQEARAAAALNHPNILAVYQMGMYEQAPYLVSELLQGETLRARLKRGPLPVNEAVDYAVQIATGLAAAHEKGIMHRDLKPENLFVTKGGHIKILDFGLAKQTHVPSLPTATGTPLATEPGVVLGTVGYMSPEQVRGQTADQRSDIFSFGAILYEMLSGKRAFQGQSSADTMSAILKEDPPEISRFVSGIPSVLQSVVYRCLEKTAEQRFQSAEELLTDLHGLGQVQPGKVATPHVRGRLPRKILWAAVSVLAVAAAGYLFYRWRAGNSLTDKDTIILADFTNSTGDAVFDDTLKQALNLALAQSPFLDIVPDSKIRQTLKQMTRPANTPLTPEVAREVCQRAGSKAYVAGAIASLGNEYAIGLKAVNCQNNETLANEHVTVPAKERVLGTLGQAAATLRGELGESMTTVQKFDVPLDLATTQSLDAMKAYALGRKAYGEGQTTAALPYFLRAIQLDPNFASAYFSAGGGYFNLGEKSRAQQYLSKAFQLADHVSQRERNYITAGYYLHATGQLELASSVSEEEITNYPRSRGSYNTLGEVYLYLGRFDKAAEAHRQELRLSPDRYSGYANLANCLIALQRFNEAKQVLHQALARKLDGDIVRLDLYTLAFLDGDPSAQGEQLDWFRKKPGYEDEGLEIESDTEAYGGHLSKGWDLTKQAVQSALNNNNKEDAASWWANAAGREAVFGDLQYARRAAREALKTLPDAQGIEIQAALALGMSGDPERAASLAQDLSKRFPQDTQVQSLWLPTIQAQLALAKRDPAAALDRLQTAAPMELAPMHSGSNACLYPVYVRGEAYLAAGQGSAAAGEFQKILDHSGIVWNCATGAVAHLGLARANALQARTTQGAEADAAKARAIEAYHDFLLLWKDADPDIPVLRQAKAEYAKLR